METIADLQLLEVADMLVEPGQSSVAVAAEIKAEVAVEAVRLRQIADLGGDKLGAPRIAGVRRRIFVDQRLELRCRPVGFGSGHGRHEMVDHDRSNSPFGLRALP